jgi:hypothetical protein
MNEERRIMKQMGYWERSYEHGPNKEFLKDILRGGRFNGLSPDGFFHDRVAILESYIKKFSGRLDDIKSEKVNPTERLGISALVRRIASFQLPEDQSLKVIDYSSISTVDCFPTGTEYRGKIILKGDSEELYKIQRVCQLVFPTNDEILKYI